MRELKRGDTGEDVKLLQQALADKRFPVEVTGIFNANTEIFLIAYQAEEGLTKNGICDLQTWQTIIK